MLRSVLAKAICQGFAPLVAFFFLPQAAPSLNLNASMGETFPAILPGLLMDIKTVMSSKKAAAIKMTGEVLMVREFCEKLDVAKTAGVSTVPSMYPRISPTGIPIRQRKRACRRIILLTCL